jgi:hypothetical protein
MNSCKFKEIFVCKNFKIDNGVLGFERHIYLNIIKFLGSSNLRKVLLSTFVLFNFYSFCDSTLEFVRNLLNEWNTSILLFTD